MYTAFSTMQKVMDDHFKQTHSLTFLSGEIYQEMILHEACSKCLKRNHFHQFNYLYSFHIASYIMKKYQYGMHSYVNVLMAIKQGKIK